MNDDEKWRRTSDRLLAAPVARKRGLDTVTGKVADRFDSIMAARCRGMGWIEIANAISNASDSPLKGESVESAFRRLCKERGIAIPLRTQAAIPVTQPKSHSAGHSAVMPGDLFSRGRRLVDNGDD